MPNDIIPASGRIRVMDVEVDEAAGSLTFAFKNGSTFEFNVNQLNEGLARRALLHGVEQKLRDSAAGVKGNIEEAYNNIVEVGTRLLNGGPWNVGREGGGGGAGALWIEGVMRVRGWTDKKEATEKLMALDEEKRDAIKKHPTVVAAVAQIKADRAAAELAKAQAGAAEAPTMDSLFDL